MGLQGRQSLDGRLRFDAVPLGFALPVEEREFAVKARFVLRQIPAEHRGVGCEDGGDFNVVPAQVGQSGTGHPLVKVSHNIDPFGVVCG